MTEMRLSAVHLRGGMCITLFTRRTSGFSIRQKFTEPDFHENGMDNPDNPCNVVLSDKELLDYLHKVQIKTENYLDNLSDEDLNEKPDGCEYTRLELILGQFRHISSHIGMINGQTIERTGRFPVFSGLDGKQTDKLYDE